MLSVSGTKSCSNSLTSSAATIIGSNGNLLVDLLYCLPVKSLCAFKTVSKQWQSLISDPYFERNYNLRSRRLSVPALLMNKELMNGVGGSIESEFETLVMDEQNGIDYVPSGIPIPVDRESHVIFEQSCNGLVLCRVYDESYSHKTYVIYNPSMKHYKTLPSPLFIKTGDPRELHATLAFDPAKSSYYQVVGVWSIKDTNKENMHHIQIYSSETDSWRDVGEPFPFSSPAILSESGVFWNGSVHWIDRSTATLHYYDINCELMKKMAMPTQPYLQIDDYFFKIGYFRECRGRIHLMEMRDGGMLHFDIWEMRMDYTGWNLKYYVDLTPLTTVYPGLVLGPGVFHCLRLYVLFIEESEDSSRLIFRIARDRVIISFDLKNNSFKKMYDVKPNVDVEGFEYIETLAHA